MKKILLLSLVIFSLSKSSNAQFMFTPQVDLSYAMMDFRKTNGFGIGLGVKMGYVMKNEHRISATAAYDYYFGRKDKKTKTRGAAAGHIPLKLHYSFPILESKNDSWYLEPSFGYSIFGTKDVKYNGFVGGISFGTFSADSDAGDMSIGFDVAKYKDLPGIYGMVSLRFGFLSMFSGGGSRSYDEPTYQIKSMRVLDDDEY